MSCGRESAEVKEYVCDYCGASREAEASSDSGGGKCRGLICIETHRQLLVVAARDIPNAPNNKADRGTEHDADC